MHFFKARCEIETEINEEKPLKIKSVFLQVLLNKVHITALENYL